MVDTPQLEKNLGIYGKATNIVQAPERRSGDEFGVTTMFIE